MAGVGLPLRAQTLTPVRVTTALRLANYTPAYTALREGIFAKHGLEVEIAAASSVAEPISILNAGRAEFAMTGTGMAVNSAIEGADGRSSYRCLRAERVRGRTDDKRRKELVKTTGTGKPSKGSIDWMRAQGTDVLEFEAELAAIERRLAPLVEEAETIDAMLAPYEAIKEELKEARATLRRLKAAFVERLTAARAELDDEDCRELVLDIDRERSETDSFVSMNSAGSSPADAMFAAICASLAWSQSMRFGSSAMTVTPLSSKRVVPVSLLSSRRHSNARAA